MLGLGGQRAGHTLAKLEVVKVSVAMIEGSAGKMKQFGQRHRCAGHCLPRSPASDYVGAASAS
jgi:hypothetical protein